MSMALNFKERLSIVLSVLAFCISSISFYLTVVRSADPDIIAGSSIYIFHDIYGKASVAMSLSMSNNGARPAVVERLGLLVRHSGQKDYLLTPSAFQKINEKGEPQDESMAGPVVIPGRSETRKQLLFKASQQDDQFSLTAQGKYAITLLAWLAAGSAPIAADTFTIELSEIDANKLLHWYELNVTNSVVVEKQQWKDWRPGFIDNSDSLFGTISH